MKLFLNKVAIVLLLTSTVFSPSAFANDLKSDRAEKFIGTPIRKVSESLYPMSKLARKVNDLQKEDSYSPSVSNKNKYGYYLQYNNVIAKWMNFEMPGLLKFNLDFDIYGGWNYDLNYDTKIGVEAGLFNQVHGVIINSATISKNIYRTYSQLNNIPEYIKYHNRKYVEFSECRTRGGLCDIRTTPGKEGEEKALDYKKILEIQGHVNHIADKIMNILNLSSSSKEAITKIDELERKSLYEQFAIACVKNSLIRTNTMSGKEEYVPEGVYMQYKEWLNSLSTEYPDKYYNMIVMYVGRLKAMQGDQNVHFLTKALAILNAFMSILEETPITNIAPSDIFTVHRLIVSGIYTKRSHKIPELSFYTGLGAGYGVAIKYINILDGVTLSQLKKSFDLSKLFKDNYKKAFHHDIAGLVKFGVNYKLTKDWSVSFECDKNWDVIFRKSDSIHQSKFKILNYAPEILSKTKFLAGLRYEF